MSVLSSLEISNWNEEAGNPVDLSKPELVDYFTVNSDTRKLSKDINYLKYFDKKVKLDVFSIKSKFNDNPVSVSLPIKKEFEDWMEVYSSEKCVEDVEIITIPSVLSTIMNTPFDISGDKKKWNLCATFEKNKIFLTQKSIVKPTYICKVNKYKVSMQCMCDYNRNNCHKYRIQSKPEVPELLKQCELLKRYMFVRKPENFYRKVLSKWDKLFYEIYRLNIGDNKVLYLSETPGVLSEQKLNSIEELKTAEYIYCDMSEVGEFTQEVINYNPVWWSRCQLINAKQCFIGIYNDRKEELQEIFNFKTDKFNDNAKYENLWSPNAAWNFLNDVLTFIKHEVYDTDAEFRSDCLWEFSSYENDKPFITVTRRG